MNYCLLVVDLNDWFKEKLKRGIKESELKSKVKQGALGNVTFGARNFRSGVF